MSHIPRIAKCVRQANPKAPTTYQVTSKLSDLIPDSLNRVEFIIHLEDEFEIEITEDQAATLETINDINDMLEFKLR